LLAGLPGFFRRRSEGAAASRRIRTSSPNSANSRRTSGIRPLRPREKCSDRYPHLSDGGTKNFSFGLLRFIARSGPAPRRGLNGLDGGGRAGAVGDRRGGVRPAREGADRVLGSSSPAVRLTPEGLHAVLLFREEGPFDGGGGPRASARLREVCRGCSPAVRAARPLRPTRPTRSATLSFLTILSQNPPDANRDRAYDRLAKRFFPRSRRLPPRGPSELEECDPGRAGSPGRRRRSERSSAPLCADPGGDGAATPSTSCGGCRCPEARAYLTSFPGVGGRRRTSCSFSPSGCPPSPWTPTSCG